MTLILFEVLPILAALSTILIVTSRNAVVSILYLISTFVCIASYLILEGITFIGLSYIVVYVGAVAVLFLFVIIIINVQEEELTFSGSAYTQNIPLALVIGVSFVYTIIASIPTIIVGGSHMINYINNISTTLINVFTKDTAIFTSGNVYEVFNTNKWDTLYTPYSTIQVQSLSTIFYSYTAVWLILLSIILLLSIIGPISLTIPKKLSPPMV